MSHPPHERQPCNVLLKGDGHIKLADMGGVAEFAEGTCLETNKVRREPGRYILHTYI